ncbi:hypothetical protein SprV_0100401000 [Sparganum proliferum]
MLTNAYRNERPTLGRIDYRTDGHLLTSRRMQASTRLSTTRVHDLLLGKNCAPKTGTEADMQTSMDLFASGCTNFGLNINTDKAVVIHQPPPNAAHSIRRIHVNDTQLKIVDNFACLDGILSRCIKIEKGVTYRLSKASQTFGPL